MNTLPATLAAQDRARTKAVVDSLDRQALREALTAILG